MRTRGEACIQRCNRCANADAVEQEHVGVADERECDEQALELSPRGRADRLAGLLFEADPAHELRQVISGLHHVTLCGKQIEAGDRQVAFEIELLRDVADPRSRCPSHATMKRDRTDECLKQHRLPASIRPDHCERFTALDAKAELVEHAVLPERDREVFDDENG
jgi:hypothetical protein